MFTRLDSEKISICSDGLYRLVREDAGWLTLGVLVSDACREKSGHSTSYIEVVFGFFGTEKKAESCRSYLKLLECFCMSVQRLVGEDVKPKIQALHGDFAPGLEAARQAFFAEDAVTR